VVVVGCQQVTWLLSQQWSCWCLTVMVREGMNQGLMRQMTGQLTVVMREARQQLQQQQQRVVH
jgi:hypothetical protein